eukprot:7872291-Pyramimonas_sp.AAC.1
MQNVTDEVDADAMDLPQTPHGIASPTGKHVLGRLGVAAQQSEDRRADGREHELQHGCQWKGQSSDCN